MHDLRKVEILKNGQWCETNFESICAGDTFRMFESTSEAVVDKNGNTQFVAKTNPYMTSDGVLGVDI